MLKISSQRSAPGATARVREMLLARFGAGEEAWLVSSVDCLAPGCPPRQTLIACLHPAARITFRINKPVELVTFDDVEALGERHVRAVAEACC